MTVPNKGFAGLSALARFLEKLKTVFVQKTDVASNTVTGVTKLYNYTGQNTDGAVNQKVVTDGLDSKLPIAGGTLKGDVYTSPYYDSTITSPEGGQVLIVCKGQNAKGTPPETEAEYHTLAMAVDNTGSTNNLHKYGQIETAITTTGVVHTEIKAYKDVADSASAASLAVYITPDGTSYAVAPTPASLTDNSTKIVTTAFLNDYDDTNNITSEEILALFRTQ